MKSEDIKIGQILGATETNGKKVGLKVTQVSDLNIEVANVKNPKDLRVVARSKAVTFDLVEDVPKK